MINKIKTYTKHKKHSIKMMFKLIRCVEACLKADIFCFSILTAYFLIYNFCKCYFLKN